MRKLGAPQHTAIELAPLLVVLKTLVATAEPEPKNVFPEVIVKVTNKDEAVKDRARFPMFLT